jgi:Rrf2 family protein
MELNTKGRYAVMAMADIAKYGGAEQVPLSSIAERQQLSLDYLEQLFLRLRRAGLVESTRGRLGGYRLGRPASEIRIGEIMAAVDEETRMTRCLGGAAPCFGDERCLTHGLWSALGDAISAFVWSVTLQEVLEGIPAEKLVEPPVIVVHGENAVGSGSHGKGIAAA